MKLIPKWPLKRNRCYFCGTTKSVKYHIDVPSDNGDGYKIVNCCNKCALTAKIYNK